MGNFKQFLLNEEQGLGYLGHKLDTFIHSQDLEAKIGGAFMSTDVSGTEQSELGSQGHPLYLPSTDLSVPQVEKTGRITTLLSKRNPIYVRLSDGTEAHFTYDEFRKIEGEPALGKTMTLTFQRHPEDITRTGSKIDKAIVRD